MKRQQAPEQVEATAAALRCFYNGEMEAIRRAGAVVFPAQSLFTVDDPTLPAHAATFSIPADSLTPETLENAFYDTCHRFAK